MNALIYFSFSQTKFNKLLLAELEITSKKNNHNLNITGLLSYHNNYFYQYLEGDERLNILMHKIENDNRHTIEKILHFDNLTDRIFPKCYMKCVEYNQNILTEDLLIRNLFSFVKNEKPVNIFVKSSFIQNLLTIKNHLWYN